MTARVVIAVTNPADEVMVHALVALQPLFEERFAAVRLVGGLMTRIWRHASGVDWPIRPTADVDLGADRHQLRVAGDAPVLTPLLQRLGFVPDGAREMQFRFRLDIEGTGPAVVDIIGVPGRSRDKPPILEEGLETIEGPGLEYAFKFDPVSMCVEFVDIRTDQAVEIEVPLPPLDAAVVLKGALAGKRQLRIGADLADLAVLADALLEDEASIQRLLEHRAMSSATKAIANVERLTQSLYVRHVADELGPDIDVQDRLDDLVERWQQRFG